MELQRGTTGFRHVDDAPLPSTDARQFRADLYLVAREVSAKVVYTPRRNPSGECSFYDALAEVDGLQIRILLNVTHPLLAFADDWVSVGSPIQFIDSHELGSAFSTLGRYSVLKPTILNMPVTKDVFSQLAEAEVEQMEYWKPNRIGDLIFNYWD
ncbi:MAG: hypothetical protein MPJ50_03575 [Pirellulales bacterium]|nr:hypothetical protein [Pirellulales bacterium]